MSDSRMTDRWSIGSARLSLQAASSACWVLVLLSLLLTAGCGDEEGRKAALTTEEIERLTYAPKPIRPGSLIVAGETITCEDIVSSPSEKSTSGVSFKQELEAVAANTTLEQFMASARPTMRRLLNGRISNIVLYQRAKRQLGDKVDETLDTVAEKELRRFVLEHGGNNAQADEALRAMGMNRSTYKEYKKKQMLLQYAISSKLPKDSPITFREMKAAYDLMKDDVFVDPGVIQFRLIDIQAAKMELTDPNEDPVHVARALAESLVTRIIDGEDFGKLAEEYSHGHRRSYGGLWTARAPESLAEPYAVLAEISEKIEVGQIAGPIDVPGHAFIMKLEEKQPKGYKPLAEVQEQVVERIKFERRKEASRLVDEEVAEQSAVANTEPFLDECLERLYRSAQASSPAL